jgi:protein phosphatase
VFKQHLGNEYTNDVSSALTQAFLDVDSQLAEYEYMGCTATAVFVWQVDDKRYVQAANVGDSTAFLNRGSGGVLWLTRDHKASSEEERERIRASGAEINSGQTRVSGGLAVSRALGDHFLKNEKVGLIAEPYVSPAIEIGPEDSVVVLASDGVSYTTISIT